MKYVLVLGVWFFFISCNGQDNTKHSQYDSTAILLNNEAVDIYISYSENLDSMTKALLLLDSAIKIDKTYQLAYINKYKAYCKIGKPYEAIDILQQLIILKPNPDALLFQGHIFENIGNQERALQNYNEALKIIDTKLANEPNNVQFQLSRAYLIFFIKGADSGLVEMDKLNRMHPDDENVTLITEVLKSMERKSFIQDFCKKTVFEK